MKTFEKIQSIRQKNHSILCVGLDTNIEKLPKIFDKNVESILKFNKSIIDATSDLVCAYKINFAFYEQYGVEGFSIIKKTIEYIGKNIVVIADAKRGDIGNTSKAYAKSVFEYFNADAITVNPYMGQDSIKPFLDFKDKMTFVLAVTSNRGSLDFQRIMSNGKPIYQYVIDKSKKWADSKILGYVIGATHPDVLKQIRQDLPNNCFLIPGIGAQGGSIIETIQANQNGPAIINVSRSIIYASIGDDYIDSVRKQAEFFKNSFNTY